MALVAQRVLLAVARPGASDQSTTSSIFSGARAFGIGSGSMNGVRISGLVGNFSL